MSADSAIPIVSTKLYPPQITGDLVTREKLLTRLEEGCEQPLTLVAAPAGYGKSTLIGHWLGNHEGPSAWLSLGESDDDLRTFVSYIVAALRTASPEVCRNTFSLTQGRSLPKVETIWRCLCSDLEATEDRTVLVLDDYHHIQKPTIHELVDLLLKYPLRSLHLVIISRRDPPLSLARLRARDLAVEVRMGDLQFTAPETEAFLRRVVGLSVTGAALSRLYESTEGWPVGLRLAAIAIRQSGDVEELVRGLDSRTQHIQEYLLEEVLSRESSAVRDHLCQTAVLDRFCAPLCEAVCGLGSEGFAKLLNEAGLVCFALDTQGEWHRYHHLLRDLLRHELKSRMSGDQIASLHKKASDWFAENGLVEEAIKHALLAPGEQTAAELVAQNGNEAMNREEYVRLGRWLDMLGRDTVERDPRLLILRAWVNEYYYKFDDGWKDVALAEPLLSALPVKSAVRLQLSGETAALRSQQHYYENDAGAVIAGANQALSSINPDAQAPAGFAVLLLAAGHQMRGELDRAYAVLDEALNDRSRFGTVFRARVFIARCWIHWLTGDLNGLQHVANALLSYGERHSQRESADFGRYFLGVALYHRGELIEAERVLTPIVEKPFVTRTELYAHSAFVIALCNLAWGEAQAAHDLADSVLEHMLEVDNTSILPIAQAFLAEIAVRRGHLSEARQWARRFRFEPLLPFGMFYEPPLTLARVMVLDDNPIGVVQGGDVLRRLLAHVSQTHNTHAKIEVLALQALRYRTIGDDTAALKSLQESVELAQPGGYVQVFADMGPQLAALFNLLELDEAGLRYVGRILAAMRDSQSILNAADSTVRQTGVDPLSKREIEILTLIAKRLSNQEIADQLHISTVTVKRHSANIYEKLGVHGRRDAAAKAEGLGILAT